MSFTACRPLCMVVWALCGLGAAAAPAFDPPAGADSPPPGPAEAAPALPEDTAEVLVFLDSGTDAADFARRRGLQLERRLRSGGHLAVLRTASPQAARALCARLEGDPAVRAAFVNRRTAYWRMAFVPNDPYFPRNSPSPGWPGQWHLVNAHVPGRDARVQGAWNRDLTGSGVIIGVVDDGLETGHPDLAPNYRPDHSWDFGQGDPVPDPVYADDRHGVSVAGVAAARGGNAIGVTGAAPQAGLAGLRIDFSAQTVQMFVDATLYRSSGADRAIKVKNHSYAYTSPFIATAAEVAALDTSAAAGTIHCFAAGNSQMDANRLDLQKHPRAITVAAMGSDGRYASYSNFGACVFTAAPSSAPGLFGITTTDRTGEAGYNGSDTFPDNHYTAAFGGTSSASPLVAGVLALAVQVRPELDARFARHLLARTSDIVDAADASTRSGGGWVTNAAGLHFNQNYGFGLIDADELTALAATHLGVTPLAVEETGTFVFSSPIPDNNAVGVSRTFSLSSAAPLEEVLVYIRVSHSRRGDLEAWLTSPSGTAGRVFMRSASDTGSQINWTFTCNQFWGEHPAGTWTLTVKDLAAGVSGTWQRCALTARMGRLLTPPTPDIDADGDADQADFAGVQACLGTGQALLTEDCRAADLDLNNQVDPADIGLFLGCMTAPGTPPAPGCLNP